MAKSLAEITAEVTAWLAGRKLDLTAHDFDNLTILQQSQDAPVELSTEELRAMLKEQKGRGSCE